MRIIWFGDPAFWPESGAIDLIALLLAGHPDMRVPAAGEPFTV